MVAITSRKTTRLRYWMSWVMLDIVARLGIGDE